MHSDTTAAYGTVSRVLHWLMAAAFVYMLFTVVSWSIDEENFDLLDHHKSVGFLLLLLAALRLVWSLLNRRRRPSVNLLARLGHAVLYALMVAVPLVGLMREYGAARSDMRVFGVSVMARAPERIEWMTRLGGEWHDTLAWILFALAAGHIVMALVHQIKGDKVINRMAGPRR